MKKIGILLVCMMLLTSFIVFFPIETIKADILYVDIGGGADYTSIQDAIDNANSGDTIIVKDGTYIENINIDKSSLTISSESDDIFISLVRP